MASKAQKRTVSDSEVERYKQYDAVFGAKYMDEGGDAGGGEPEEEEW